MLNNRILSRKGQHDELRFLIGLIIAVTVLFFFARCTIGALSSKGADIKTFNALADKIAKFQADSGSNTQMTTHLVRIEGDKPWLFFDRGTDYLISVWTGASWDHYKDLIMLTRYDPRWYLNELMGVVSGQSYIHAYYKPPVCGDSACMVLCKQPKMKIVDRLTITVSDKNPQPITINSPDIGLIECASYEIRVFDNIDKFYRKAFESGNEGNILNCQMTPLTIDSAYVRLFSPGFALETGPFKNTIRKTDQSYEDVYVNDNNCRIAIYEKADGKPHATKVIFESDYLTMQVFNNVVVACYQTPCLLPSEEFYLLWQHNLLNPCIKDSKCSALNEKISDIKKLNYYQKISLTESASFDGLLELVVNVAKLDADNSNEQDFPFEYDVNLRVFKYGESTPTSEPTSIEFSKMQRDNGDVIVAMRFDGSDAKIFKTLSSPPLKEGETVKNLDFYFEERTQTT